ncbi:MAG: PspC domain-containing protein [Bacillota bacterium]|nr:PspC domain-containing protein [Bacillota bacterium]MDP4171602.1 PspC domain-containing protein [Bacillota bacterium]
MKRIVRSRTDRMLAGVLGGLSSSLSINATLLRVAFVVLMFATAFFPMVILYLVLLFILPHDRDTIV